jgi:hypothetical protein
MRGIRSEIREPTDPYHDARLATGPPVPNPTQGDDEIPALSKLERNVMKKGGPKIWMKRPPPHSVPDDEPPAKTPTDKVIIK